MASWTTIIGAATTEQSSSIFWNLGGGGHLIPTSLVAGGGTAYLTYLNLPRSASEALNLNTNAADTGAGFGAGPDLTETWENNTGAQATYRAGGLTLEVSFIAGGPDTSEPYQKTINSIGPERAQLISDFCDAYVALTTAQKNGTTVTLDDGVTADAVAPTLTVTAADTEIDDDETTLISVAASGGTYDEITYSFTDAASGAFTGSGAARTYKPAGVNAQTVRTVTVTATATGTGTEAAKNTTDDSTASIDITVNPGLSTYEVNGRCRVSSVPTGTNRTMTIRCCIQGQFGDGTEGLLVEWRPGTSGAWTQAAFIHGWTYSNTYTTGDSITDENGVARTIVANGGWIDVDVSIPNNAGQVALQPRYIVPGGQDTFHHDIAIRSIAWS